VINSEDSNPSDSENLGPVVDIVVVDPTKESYDIAEKQRLAYNAALIGQYEVSIELYKQVLSLDPKSFYAKFSLAVVYQKIGQFRQAKTLYYQLLKSNPEKQEEIIGNILAILIEESPRDALYLLSRLTLQNPKSAYVFAQAAVAYEKLKNYEQAINLLQKAASIDAKNLGYKYNLAVIYDKIGQYEKAIELYSDIVKNYSEDVGETIAPRAQIQKRIASIKNKI
jgi:lipopolysaccharide assembly protein B